MFPMKAQYPNFYSVEKSQCNKFKEIKQEVAFGPYEGGPLDWFSRNQSKLEKGQSDSELKERGNSVMKQADKEMLQE